jgi:cardiolipin synthase
VIWDHLGEYWQEITGWTAVLNVVVVTLTIGWVLTIKKDSMSATAWCLLVLLLPFLGPILFVLLGWQNVQRPVERKQKHKDRFRQRRSSERREAFPGTAAPAEDDTTWEGLGQLAQRFEAFPMTPGNQVHFYYEGRCAFDAKLEAIRSAKHHIHLEYFIFQPDDIGRTFLAELEKKAREGVQVRLLYDAMGSHRLHRRMLQSLIQAGGRFSIFLPLNPLRRRIQVNLRNHRKILVVDGRTAFTGGLNIGDEYLGKVPRFGFWRDTHMRIEGPAVAALQWVFAEDWDFAYGENLRGDAYFPTLASAGSCPVQVIHSGPDQELKSIREIYYAAISRAREMAA